MDHGRWYDIVKDPNLVPFLIKELIQIDDDWDVFYTDIDSTKWSRR